MAQSTNIQAGVPSITHEATLGVKIADAWALLKEFGSWGKWCPLFENMRITNGQTGVGAIRKFKTTVGNMVYEERLTELNDDTHTLSFEMVSMNPQVKGLTAVSNKIVLKSADDGKATFVQRLAWNVTQGLEADYVAVLLHKQRMSFDKENQVLRAHLYAEDLVKHGMSFFNEKILTLTRAILNGQSETWEYEEYPDHLGYLPKMVKGLPLSEVLPANKLGDMLTRFIELVYHQARQYIARELTPKQDQPKSTTGNLYADQAISLIEKGFAEPKGLKELTKYLAENWESDVEFCQQLLQGANPMHIKRVESLDEVPDLLQSLTATDKVGTKSVKELVEEKRLFILDYRELANFKQLPHEPTSYFYAPVMLVYREILDDKNSRLNVLGIQLHPSKSEIFTPQMKQTNRYKLARMFVACADIQYHEFRYHLGIAHMGMEPFAISTHNRLPKNHPIKDLLTPHLEGTIGIAFFARQTLIAEKEAFTEKTFAIGTKQGVMLASEGWRKYHFYKNSFPQQLASRGFDEACTDGVQGYYYREDGFKLWNLIGEYTTDAVNHIYKTDEDVRADGNLQMWADETAAKDGAAVPGFPSEIKTKKELAEVLQIIIWNGSAQHSVVNFPQAPYLTLIPNRPNAIYRPMPDLPADGSDITEEYIKEGLATDFPMVFQLLFSWLLSLPSDSNLLNLEALKQHYPQVDKAFREKLLGFTEELNKRNKELTAAGKAPYIFLLPENVACSVNI